MGLQVRGKKAVRRIETAVLLFQSWRAQLGQDANIEGKPSLMLFSLIRFV